MKEYDETIAVGLMQEAIMPHECSDDDAYQVLDLIYEYYDEAGELDVDADDDETDVDAMASYVLKHIEGDTETAFTLDELKAMIHAEIAYEETLI